MTQSLSRAIKSVRIYHRHLVGNSIRARITSGGIAGDPKNFLFARAIAGDKNL